MKRQAVDNYSGSTTFGVDVSKYQGNIRWDKLDKSIKFIFIRAGDGRSKDSKFQQNWKKAGELGLIRGAYQYFRADRDGKSQAEKVINQIELAGGLLKTDLPPALDLEGGSIKNLPGGVFTGPALELPIDLLVEECLEFLQTIEDYYNVTPIIYTGQAFHWWLSQARPDLAIKFKKYPLWLPSYSEKPLMPVDDSGFGFPWKNWTFWQYSDKGKVEGIKGDVDLNKFRGTEEQLKNYHLYFLHDEEIENLLKTGKTLIDSLSCVLKKLRNKLIV